MPLIVDLSAQFVTLSVTTSLGLLLCLRWGGVCCGKEYEDGSRLPLKSTTATYRPCRVLCPTANNQTIFFLLFFFSGNFGLWGRGVGGVQYVCVDSPFHPPPSHTFAPQEVDCSVGSGRGRRRGSRGKG